MGAAEEDLTEPSALEECCCGPMFLRESKGLSKLVRIYEYIQIHASNV